MTSPLRTWPAAAGGSTGAHALALTHIDRAARRLGLDAAAARLLQTPARESHFTVPVRAATGQVRVLPALRVQHSDALGPAQSDVRLGADPSGDLARAHAMWITWTAAVADLPTSGAGGWIAAPDGLSLGEQEEACRGWVRQSAGHFRADLDAVDADREAWQHTAWMRDESRVLCGGLHGPSAAIGEVAPARRHAETAARAIVGALQMVRTGVLDPSDIGLSVSIQGLRPLAGLVARRVAETGALVRALAWPDDQDGACTAERPFGITVTELAGVTDGRGMIDRRRAARLGYTVLGAEAWLTQPVDAIILTSDERRLRPSDVERLHPRVRFVVEGTYGLLDAAVDERLGARGITVVPDLLTAVGRLIAHDAPCHVHASGWDLVDDLDATTDRTVTAAANDVLAASSGGRQSLRDAAYAVAVTRVLDHCRLGGWL